MKKGVVWLLAGMLLPCLAFLSPPQEIHAAVHLNDCPIILAQSWSKETEGMYRIQAILNANGYPSARTACMGPVSSAWDRACELYAQIKGGTVDYGKAHSEKYGHARYGRAYPGLYPQWGLANTTATKINMVHLIGFSFEGITSRVLVDLLENGNADEIVATKDGSLSSLFAGHHPWVFSCSTLASPDSGTTLLEAYLAYGLDSSSTLRILVLLSESVYNDTSVYDIDLDQWGFYSRTGESLNSLLNRLASQSFLDNRDFSYYDLTPNGIYALNSSLKPRPFVYYFSLSANATTKQRLGYYYPISSMTSGLKNYSVFMGVFFRDTRPYPVDGRWYPNDGLVNTLSANGPLDADGNLDIISAYYGQAFAGIWNFLGTVNKVDHFQLISTTQYYNATPWFLNFAEILYGLTPR